MTDREERLALNEAMFREVNERVEERLGAVLGEQDLLAVLCECADVGCNQRIQLSREAYERVRSDPAQFVVVPGHARSDIEDVVAHTDGYEIVRKRGEAGEVAERLDS
jgi:5-bromo-4-chloroindolyl phosphate hydrolysis protein